jgi:tRNA threonylcarbamoyladenosine biosynthesis protein TsaB
VRILALDATLAGCSAALWAGGAVVARRSERLVRGHAERLMPQVREVMAEAGLGFEALDALAVTIGPGSFTGVRIGLATARGLALASAKPLVGLTTLEVIAHGAETSEALAVAIGAGRDRVYLQTFAATREPTAPPALLATAEARGRASGLAVAGDAARLVAASVARTIPPELPDATLVAALAAERHRGGRPWPDRPPAALYLRPPDATPMRGRA